MSQQSKQVSLTGGVQHDSFTVAAAKATTNHVLDWGFCSAPRSIRKPSSGGLDKLIQIFTSSKAGFVVTVKPCVGQEIVIWLTNVGVKRTEFAKIKTSYGVTELFALFSKRRWHGGIQEILFAVRQNHQR
jgi:hypothetical protein